MRRCRDSSCRRQSPRESSILTSRRTEQRTVPVPTASGSNRSTPARWRAGSSSPPRPAVRARARHRRATRVRVGRAALRLPECHSQAPADRADQRSGPGRPRNPRRRQPRPRTDRRPANLGRLLGRPIAGSYDLTGVPWQVMLRCGPEREAPVTPGHDQEAVVAVFPAQTQQLLPLDHRGAATGQRRP